MFLLFGSFIAGALTVLAPCVLPLLPIIIGGSVSGNTKDRKRPLIITISLALSLIIFTLLLKVTTLFINIPPASITIFSGAIIIALGVLTLFPGAYALFIAKVGLEQRAQGLLASGAHNKNRYLGPIVIGAALGPVFSSCSPVYAYILATVLPANFAQALAYIVAYVIGLSLVLLLIGYFGQRFIARIRFAANPRGWFQRFIGILFIIVGLMVATGYDKRFQTFVSQHTPFNFDAVSAKFLPERTNKITSNQLFNLEPYTAPEFTGLTSWINSEPLTMKQLKGKVVLVDFWTYSCINCIRNNPYLERWHQAYKDQGLVVIGVHAPEFAFEKLPANVRRGVADQHITYPVALDNDFATWNAFQNSSWPAAYLIDASGKVRRLHEGEGNYKESEQAIRELLEANGAKIGPLTTSGNTTPPINRQQTPETYLGTSRASNYGGSPALAAAPLQTFTLPPSLARNRWALGGTWEVQDQKIIARGNSVLRYNISARSVYLVGAAPTPSLVKILVNERPASDVSAAGEDVRASTTSFADARLYRLITFPTYQTEQTVELQVPDGVELNAFTFGG